MADQNEETEEPVDKKPPRKHARTAKGNAAEDTEAVAKDAGTAAEEAAQSNPPSGEAPASPPSKSAPDILEQASASFAKVDWALRGRHLFRLVLMLFAAVAIEVSVFVIYLLTAGHFLYTLVVGTKLDEITQVCTRFTLYVKQLLDFVCYRSDEPLFPFAPFPDEDAGGGD